MSIAIKNSLPTRRTQSKDEIDQQFQQLAKDLEKEFLREMMKSMRQTVNDEGGMMQANSAEKLFKDQLDNEYIDKWGETGGVGLSKTIYNQLIEKYGAQYGLTPKEIKGIGPIAIEAQKSKALKAYQEDKSSIKPIEIKNTESNYNQEPSLALSGSSQGPQKQSDSGSQDKIK